MKEKRAVINSEELTDSALKGMISRGGCENGNGEGTVNDGPKKHASGVEQCL